ncbi:MULTISPECIES: 4-alpha-glucanotransferase [unclassified Modestobacter]|uniref:4-alpha-glucanotransferase n=1 Tax=unclassified Modestobacter TaxID=2643866 RepID=UPI0022AA3ED2|nr:MULTISPECIES: 4-alpha-glucanotransferase [unclassified Modestobacter]MCZ2825003.1 4-alpha-glucanotransferase [Modestobacter sp. VKM Ac-2981]MCZ2854494.1 4-alpha-glucanotransferase [Modestobacter sp. VKM Ac-2982]
MTSTAPPPKSATAPPTDAWGIDASWLDALDEEHTVAQSTIDRLREVIGTPPADLPDRAPIVARPGDALEVDLADVECEDGRTRQIDGELPEDFPLGYHRLRTPDGRERRLIVSPGRCWLPEGWRAWGWAVQLYATRGRESWGIGDLGDLRTVRELAQAQGAGFVLVNPLHAVAPTPGQEDSPYLPATRRFRNPVYLRIAEVPGADAVDVEADAGRALNDGELIDRDAIWALKRRVLQRVFDAGVDEGPFRDWWWHEGQPLMDWATWCAIADEHGPDWHTWPEPLRDPRGAAVADFVAGHDREIAFHAWLQWLLDVQLRAATEGTTVIQDLPIGVAGGGADAWAWQDVLAQGVSVGAPPDAFNSQGQDWGSPPLVPWRLQAADYEPFIQSIRATMAGAGGLRVDHVMGLFRLWWVPSDGSAAEGAYVRYPHEDMLDIVALESHRAQAIVVGEDLGTVEDGVREAMAEHGILSYRLLWFEDDEPAQWPAEAMAAITTHDLPTVAGLWTGSDLAEQRERGLGTEEELLRGRASLLEHLDFIAEDATPAEAVEAAHRQLATAPSTLLSATLDDALAEERRPNMPGANERPNWCLPLPVPTEELAAHPGVQAVAGVLNAGLHPVTTKGKVKSGKRSKSTGRSTRTKHR